MLKTQLFVTDSSDLIPKVVPIKNKSWIKPDGGLWTSTFSEEYGSAWIQWCDAEQYSTTNDFNGFLLYPNKDSKILTIDTFDDLMTIFQEYKDSDSKYSKSLNFELISQEYDAIHLTEKGQIETRLTSPYNLYGWDCECTLWFRWCFNNIEKYEHKNYNLAIKN